MSRITKKLIAQVLREESLDEDLVSKILDKLTKSALKQKKLLDSSGKLPKREPVNNLASAEDTKEFSKMLTLMRRQANHRGIEIIKEGSKFWKILREVTQFAINFQEGFGLSKYQAFREYITLSLRLLGNNFSLHRFNTTQDWVIKVYEAKLEIEKDPTPRLTERICTEYVRRLVEITGEEPKYAKDPEKYVNFIKVAEVAKQLGIGYLDYLEAQFEIFNFRHTFPEPYQLIGEKPKIWAQKYIVKNGIEIRKEKKGPKIDFSKIRDEG